MFDKASTFGEYQIKPMSIDNNEMDFINITERVLKLKEIMYKGSSVPPVCNYASTSINKWIGEIQT